MSIFSNVFKRVLMAGSSLALLAACDGPLDMDLRGNFGNAFNTADAARGATAPRPKPDDRGIISYPNYQVAVARRGDTVETVAARIGVNPLTLSAYNGIKPSDSLRTGEVLALRNRVAEPSPETGAIATGPILPPENSVDISALAGSAIANAGDQRVETTTLPDAQPAARPAPTRQRGPKPQTGREPTRHKVERGETAFTISRLYGVSVRSLAEWNGLGSDFTIREGQQLLIPVAAETPRTRPGKPATAATSAPGTGTQTPLPPSASTALPSETTVPANTPIAQPASPDLGPTSTTRTKMGFPVQGNIIREYASGKNEGIDISAAAGTPILAAKNGTVAAITSDENNIPIIVVKHSSNVLTVYANVDNVLVEKGDRVKRGQPIAKIRKAPASYVHFEVRKGFESVDPMPYLQ